MGYTAKRLVYNSLDPQVASLALELQPLKFVYRFLEVFVDAYRKIGTYSTRFSRWH